MSRDKSVWFAEEILLDAKLINLKLEIGEWEAVEEMLKAEAQLSKDQDTGRLRPKKASEYTLRVIAEVLHIMRVDIEQSSYNLSTLGVADQCLRLVRSCAASGTKMQTYISKELTILDSMLVISTEYQHPSQEFDDKLSDKFETLMTVVIQTLGNLVVNNPFNQIIIWDKFEGIILNCLVGHNQKIASAAAMIVYNILLGQPNVLPDDVFLLNSLAYMYNNGNTEFPHLIIEYLIGVENTYIERLYSKLDSECRILVLNLAFSLLMSPDSSDINVSVNFVRFMSNEFKVKSDCILKTVDKYVAGVDAQEVVFLLEILATASSMDAYIDTLQNDASLFINCAFLLKAIHKIGKESNNYFSPINKLCNSMGINLDSAGNTSVPQTSGNNETNLLRKNESSDTMLSCLESESDNGETYFDAQTENSAATAPENAESKGNGSGSNSVRKISLEHKIDIDELEPPLIIDNNSPSDTITTISEVIPVKIASETLLMDESKFAKSLSVDANEMPSTSQEIPPIEKVEKMMSEASAENPSHTDEPKKSQNVSTEFDLSEQLQKILGTRADKSELVADETKKNEEDGRQVNRSDSLVKEVKIVEERNVKLPTVKIDSPESNKTRIGAVDTSNVKQVQELVQSVESHVAFGFKAMLIRLAANLCWKMQRNKQQIRSLGVIPVLLECCSIDQRNPLIMQWAIFAIRNLCENCPENQELIKQLSLKGAADNEALKEFGVTLDVDAKGNRIGLAPFKP